MTTAYRASTPKRGRVAKSLLPLLVALLLTSCATVEERAFRLCPGVEEGSWQFMPSPPSDAEAMIALAQIKPPEHYFPRVRLYWFENGEGRYLLCRGILDYVVLPSCGSDSWEFQREGDHWTTGSGLEHIVVCGG